MSAYTTEQGDQALEALEELSAVAAASVDELIALDKDLADIKRQRRNGRSWRRIMTRPGARNPFLAISRVGAKIASAGGAARRGVALALRGEGMKVREIADHFDVSRQRIGSMIRPNRP